MSAFSSGEVIYCITDLLNVVKADLEGYKPRAPNIWSSFLYSLIRALEVFEGLIKDYNGVIGVYNVNLGIAEVFYLCKKQEQWSLFQVCVL